jgi:hypothetical protein
VGDQAEEKPVLASDAPADLPLEERFDEGHGVRGTERRLLRPLFFLASTGDQVGLSALQRRFTASELHRLFRR